jgi:hypothetical protein
VRGHSAPYPPLSLLEQLEVELRFEPPAQIVARRNSLDRIKPIIHIRGDDPQAAATTGRATRTGIFARSLIALGGNETK